MKEEFDEYVFKMRQLLNSKLVDMGLSVRALNCLKSAEVETLGNLVKYQKNDLLKFRNFGKKLLTELDDLIARHCRNFHRSNLLLTLQTVKQKDPSFFNLTNISIIFD